VQRFNPLSHVLAMTGIWLAAIVLFEIGICVFLFNGQLLRSPPNGTESAIIVLAGIPAGALGCGLGYVYMRMRSAKDPNFDDQASNSGSQIADVVNPRDRDDIVADD
jgi:hypothetical protein